MRAEMPAVTEKHSFLAEIAVDLDVLSAARSRGWLLFDQL